MSGARRRPGPREAALPGAWLAIKLGVEPRALDARRRAGELLAVRAPDGSDFVYPMWQFDAEGRPNPAVARVVQTARRSGLDDEALYDLLLRRQGMTSGERLVDALRAGREHHVLEAVRRAAARP